MRALFVSKNLIGDGLYISPALRQWHAEHPDAKIVISTHQNHVTQIYSRMGVPADVITYQPTGRLEEPSPQEPNDAYDLEDFDFVHTFDVSAAFKVSHEKRIHVAEAYAEILGVKLESKPDGSHLRPTFIPTPEELTSEEKGVILVSMFSKSDLSLVQPGHRPNKLLPWGTWATILRYLRTLDLPIRYIGGPTDRTWALPISEEEYLLGVSLNRTALIMRGAKLVVTIDNGMSHLAASQNAPTFLFYPRWLPEFYILPKGNVNLEYIYMDPTSMHPAIAVTMMKHRVPGLLKRKEESPIDNGMAKRV